MRAVTATFPAPARCRASPSSWLGSAECHPPPGISTTKGACPASSGRWTVVSTAFSSAVELLVVVDGAVVGGSRVVVGREVVSGGRAAEDSVVGDVARDLVVEGCPDDCSAPEQAATSAIQAMATAIRHLVDSGIPHMMEPRRGQRY